MPNRRPSAPTPADRATMREWRRRYRQAEWARLAAKPGRRAFGVVRALARPFHAALVAARAVRRPRAAAAAREGTSQLRQFGHLWWLRVVHGVEPHSYYDHRLHEPARWARAHGVVRERELTRLAYLLDEASGSEGRRTLADKEQAAAWCQHHGFPTAAVLVSVESGQVMAGTAADLPDVDLFSKLTRTYGGTGARRWRRCAPGQWVASDGGDSPDGVPVDRHGVVAAAAAQSLATGMPVVIQRALANHPALAGLTNGALATLRFVTLRTRDGAVHPSSAMYRMPTGDAVIDAFSHGGLVAPVDLATGQLGAGLTRAMATRGTRAATHPDTGAPITGTVLPAWRDVVALVTRAHVAVPGRVPLIGWDVALTADGPVLIEGNIPPSSELQQLPTGTPLGETPVVACLLAYLREADAGGP